MPRDDARARDYRVLYDRDARALRDNHTDPRTFLARMRLNARVKTRSFATSARAAWTISQQCAVVVIHSGAHGAIADGAVRARTLVRWETRALGVGLVGVGAGRRRIERGGLGEARARGKGVAVDSIWARSRSGGSWR